MKKHEVHTVVGPGVIPPYYLFLWRYGTMIFMVRDTRDGLKKLLPRIAKGIIRERHWGEEV